MLNMLLGPVLGKVFDVIDKSVTDKDLAAKIKADIAVQDHEKWLKQLEATVQQNTQQTNINLEDAKSQDWFQRRWRPFIGWGCGIALFWNTAGVHIANTGIVVFAMALELPIENIEVVKIPATGADMMFELLLAILGLGGMRSAERIKGKIP